MENLHENTYQLKKVYSRYCKSTRWKQSNLNNDIFKVIKVSYSNLVENSRVWNIIADYAILTANIYTLIFSEPAYRFMISDIFPTDTKLLIHTQLRVVFRTLSSISLHKKWSFSLRISSINVTKYAVSCRFGHIYWRNL